MKVGQGGPAELEVEADRFDAKRDMELGRYSR